MYRLKKNVMSLCLLFVVSCFGMQDLFAAMQQGRSEVTIEQEFCERLRGVRLSEVDDVVRDYFNRGLDVRKTFEQFGNNLLHEICYLKISHEVFKAIVTACASHNEARVRGGLKAYNKKGLTPLQEAIFGGDVEHVKKFLASGADVTAVTGRGNKFEGCSCLSLALHVPDAHKRRDILNVLLKHNEDWVKGILNQHGLGGLTLLHDAILCGDVESVERFLALGADVTVVMGRGSKFEGDSCLSLALRVPDAHKRRDVLNVLLKHDEDWVKRTLNQHVFGGLTLLHDAILCGDVESVKRFLALGADITVVTGKGSKFEGKSCLSLALRISDAYKRRDMLNVLLEHNEDCVKSVLNQHACDGLTPLHDAILCGDVENVERFLALGADVSVITGKGNKFEGDSCLSLALHVPDTCKRREMLDVLLDHNKDWVKGILNQHDCDGLTLLQEAIFGGDVECVKRLLDCGADVTVVTGKGDKFEGKRCLSLTLRVPDVHKRRNMMDVLLKHDENWVKTILNQHDCEGQTPLHDAILCGDVESVERFLALGADITMVTGKGSKFEGDSCLSLALHLPDVHKRREMVGVLLDHNKDWAKGILNQHDWRGRTLLQDAILCGDVESVERFLALGADITAVTGKCDKFEGKSCLALALRLPDVHKRQEILDVLLKHNEDWAKRVLNQHACDGLTPLHDVILCGDVENVKRFLARGADVTTVTGKGDRFEGSSCLTLVMSIKNREQRQAMLRLVVNVLYEKGVLHDCLTSARTGMTVVRLAQIKQCAQELDEAVAEVSKSAGVQHYIDEYKKKPEEKGQEEKADDLAERFFYKLSHDFKAMSIPDIKKKVASYLQRGLDIQHAREKNKDGVQQANGDGRNLLYSVCRAELSEDRICAIIECLYQHRQEAVRELATAYDAKGLTPLHAAILLGKVAVVQNLMNVGGDLTQVTGPGDKYQGDNVLFLAMSIKDGMLCQNMLKMLVGLLHEQKCLEKYLTAVSHGRTVGTLAKRYLGCGDTLNGALYTECGCKNIDAYIEQVSSGVGEDDDSTSVDGMARILDQAQDNKPVNSLYLAHRYALQDPNLTLEQHFCYEIFHDVNETDIDTLSKRVRQELAQGLDVRKPERNPSQNLLHALCFAKISEEACAVVLDCFYRHDQDAVREALTKYSDKNFTPLHSAILLGRVRLAEKFIEMRADILALTKNRNILFLALQIKDWDRRKEMLALLVRALHAQRRLHWCLQSRWGGKPVIEYAHEHWLSGELDRAVSLVHKCDNKDVAQDYVEKMEELA